MAGIPTKDGSQAIPMRKDQRWPPRYGNQSKPVRGRGINAIQFIKKVWKTQLVNSQYVSIKSVQRHKTKPLIKFTTLTREPGQEPRIHVLRIYSADPNYKGRLSECPALKLSCNCLNFGYVFETSLALRGAADIIYSNGDFPIQTNPTIRPGCCKHTFKALMFMVINKL